MSTTTTKKQPHKTRAWYRSHTPSQLDHGAIPVQGCFNIDRITEVISMLTVRLLERGTWKNIVQSQRFLKTKDSQVIFLANGPIKFKIQLFNRLKL